MTDVTEETPLLTREECDRLELRVQEAVAHFVDRPRDAVQEADRVVEDIVGRFTEAMVQRRRTLRTAWQSEDESEKADTERLRLALRDYRELAERLLRV